MRIIVRRKAGPFTWAIIVLALVLAIVAWIVASQQAPAAETAALRERCPHTLLLTGVRTVGNADRGVPRNATYVCLPDYFTNPLQFQVVIHMPSPPVVITTRSWAVYLFLGVLAVFAAFFVYARRSARKQLATPTNPAP